VQSLYTYGYDSIEIKTKDSKAKWHWGDKEVSLPSIINYAIGRLIGAELVSSSNESYKIQVIAGEVKESFDVVLRRIFRLVIDEFETFIERYRKNDVSIIEQIELKYLQIRRFMNYALRLLNKFGHEDANKTTFYFGIIKSLSRIAESLKNLSGPPEEPLKISKKSCDLIL
jgi:phosphate uptake regulator